MAIASAISGIAGIAGQVAGAAGQASAMKQQAAAQELQADMHLRVASHNAGILMGRAGTSENNALHAGYLANFSLAQSRYQADVNRKLGKIEWDNTVKYVRMKQKTADMHGQAVEAKRKELKAYTKSEIQRHVGQGRRLLGRQRAGYAAAGVDESGSALEVMAETAGNLELERLDILTKAKSIDNDLYYGRKLVKYESDVEVAGTLKQAQANRFMTQFQAMTTEQAGIVAAAEYLQTGKNYRAEAEDYRQQADLALIEGQYQATGLMMEAAANRSLASTTMFSGAMGALGGAFKLVDGGAFSGFGRN